jgi:hypothetical protein
MLRLLISAGIALVVLHIFGIEVTFWSVVIAIVVMRVTLWIGGLLLFFAWAVVSAVREKITR